MMAENGGEVWESFDKRQSAKAANDGGAEAAKADRDDMFTRAGVAAE
jgi:hypothetical protein